MVRCNYCGEPLTFEGVEVLFFNYDGSDSWQKVDIHECDNEALYIDIPLSWTGYEFDDNDSDKYETIRCPHCHKYPFKCTEIQTYDFVEVVMFDEKKHRPWECDRLKTDEYCDTCDHEGCDNCVSDATNPYCVPSNYQQIKQE